MPSFWGCRCCNRVLLVLASNGKINFVSGGGADKGQIDDSSIGAQGEVHWLKKNRWVWVFSVIGTSACIFRGNRAAVTDSTNGWFSSAGATSNTWISNSLAVGANGQHLGIPNLNKVGPDVPSKIFDSDGTFAADCNYDNGGSAEPYETTGFYLGGKFCISTYQPSAGHANMLSVFNPDGTLHDSWSIDSATGTTAAFMSALYPLPLNDGMVILHNHASSPTARMSKLDLTGAVLWSVALPSGLTIYQRPHYDAPLFLKLANGNFLICPIDQDPVHLIDGATGAVLDSFTIPTSLTGFRSLCADPVNPDFIYAFTFGDVAHNVGQYLEKMRVSDQSVIWTSAFDGYNVYSMDAIKL